MPLGLATPYLVGLNGYRFTCSFLELSGAPYRVGPEIVPIHMRGFALISREGYLIYTASRSASKSIPLNSHADLYSLMLFERSSVFSTVQENVLGFLLVGFTTGTSTLSFSDSGLSGLISETSSKTSASERTSVRLYTSGCAWSCFCEIITHVCIEQPCLFSSREHANL